MLKKILLIALLFGSQSLLAANEIDLYKAPLKSLNDYPKEPKNSQQITATNSPEESTLQQLNQTKEEGKTIIRYQQLYKGIPIVGAQVMVSSGEVNGHLYEEIELDINPAISSDQAMEIAQKAYFGDTLQSVTEESSELQIRPSLDDKLKLVYLVSFKNEQADKKPAWPFFIIDAQTGSITKQWNNINDYSDSGPGGNEKVHEYWYGKDGLPFLEVTQNGSDCTMENNQVKLVDLHSVEDHDDQILTPFAYPCDHNTEETTNGSFSPRNDAYFFGNTIVGMYKDWYGLNALQQTNGKAMQLVMRVHFGLSEENAFWDGQTMNFGDGKEYFYPLVSLDVAGHEVAHGFTQQHSNLEYHDQSGALNEAMSDMAGVTSKAYLLEQIPLLYSRAYLQPNSVSWDIGETVTREAFGTAIRFMDIPSNDQRSADCFDKPLATSNGANCVISYNDVRAAAEKLYPIPKNKPAAIQQYYQQLQQSYIVHHASGVFNKAFYLTATRIGIKNAYHLMLNANIKYWTPNTGFKSAACGVIYAAKDLYIDTDNLKSIFGEVGVDTQNCAI